MNSKNKKPAAKLKAIFWDNDGVLVDTEEIFFRANQEILSASGISLSFDQFKAVSLERGESVLRLAANPGTDEFYRLRRRRDDLYADLLAREHLVIDGVREVLEALRGKYTMGIVTSSGHEHFEIIHRRSGLLPFFQFVLTMKDCPNTKPHPEPYLKAIERSGLSPEECLVVEDSPRGLASAVNAGLRCIVIPSKFTRSLDFQGAYKILNDIRELPSALG
ncbi:MAG TPA: HAD family phosphatase [Syntrophales bacterium]|nr:HAD family phosphatase [Syntrophales bacterium]